MPKINYLRSLIASLEPEQLKTLVEDYAHQDKNFEAFVLGKSGKVIDTGKSYADYHEELSAILKKCKTRRGFLKVTRLTNAGLGSFYKLLQSHFKNENFLTSLWMSLALIEMTHEAILMNTRYRSMNKPFKSFEKILLECRDLFDTSFKFAKLGRQDRQQIFLAFVRCWWKERERSYDQHYFEADDFFRYVQRDEDLLTLQVALTELQPKAALIDREKAKRLSAWQRVSGYFIDEQSSSKEEPVARQLDSIQARVKTELNQWR